jgi:hypothetical protein
MTDAGLIQFGARSLDCAAVLAIARTAAALVMTGGGDASIEMKRIEILAL